MKLSIIIPNYNYAEYIGETIESIIKQDYDNFEVIIVDDGSTDYSLTVIKYYCTKYPGKIICIEQKNTGQAAAINTGIKNCTGDIIGWINSDDTYCKNIFSSIMNKFIVNRNIDIIYGDMNVMDLQNHYIYTLQHYRFSYIKSVFTGFANNISSVAIFWRKSILDQVGLLNETYKCGLDNEYFSRLTYGRHVFQFKFPLGNFRQQLFTKASEQNPYWNELMSKESQNVFEKAYNRLKISYIIPFAIGRKLKILFILERRISNLFSGRYFNRYIKKYSYSKAHKN